jgi:sugar phosphate isomerase/epimerase
MQPSQPTLAVITDEVSPRLEDGIAFALDEGLAWVDVRSVGGVNFLSLDRAEQQRAARAIRDAGLSVGCLATPLLKWPPPGRGAASLGDQFGFDRRGRTDAQLYADAFEAASILGTRNLRIFSFLTYDGFALDDLRGDLEQLLKLAEAHDGVLHVENEPVCNIRTVPDLTRLMQAWRHPRLNALLDIGNAWWAGAPPTAADLEAIMPFVTLMHFKDFDRQARRVVPVGEGDIPFSDLLRVCLGATKDRVPAFIVETHVPSDPAGATRRSVAGLRAALARALGSA